MLKQLNRTNIAIAVFASLVFGTSVLRAQETESSKVQIDSRLKACILQFADDYASGREVRVNGQYTDAASALLGDEPLPLDANADVTEARFIIHRVDHRTDGNHDFVVVIGQIATPENGCMAWRRAAIAAEQIDGNWRAIDMVAQLPLTHAPNAPCAPGQFRKVRPPN